MTTDLQTRAFIVAFCPDQSQQNIAKLWATKASAALDAVVSFRSAAHRWAALGSVNQAELSAEIDRLELAGLSDLVDEIIALGTLANCGGEL